jgi:putative serine protease PepD
VRLEVTAPTGSRIGSAVVVRDDGQLLTNAHVVADADTIAVVTAEGLAVTATIVGIDHESDIAVVAIDEEFRDEAEWVPAVLGRSSTVRVGSRAVAVGSPLGLQGEPSVSLGVISGLDRRVQSSDGLTLTGLLQTDAAIAQGSSGGALVDASGTVIGITTAVAVGEQASDGLGFAVPIDRARAVIDEFLGGGGERGVWLGIEGIDGAGVAVVARVVPGSPAAEGGLREGDVLVAIDGEPTPTMATLVDELEEREPGDVVVLDVQRDGEPMEMQFVLEER